jgi:hypothetical protein
MALISDELYLRYLEEAENLIFRGYVNNDITPEELTYKLLKERDIKNELGTLHQPLFVPKE